MCLEPSRFRKEAMVKSVYDTCHTNIGFVTCLVAILGE